MGSHNHPREYGPTELSPWPIRDRAEGILMVGGPGHGQIASCPHNRMQWRVSAPLSVQFRDAFYEPYEGLMRSCTYDVEDINVTIGGMRLTGWYWRYERMDRSTAIRAAIALHLSGIFLEGARL